METIFIGYVHEDAQMAEWLESELRSRGYSIFRDTASPASGDIWKSEIEQAIRDALAVIFLVSPDSSMSEYVLMEFNAAIRYERQILPLEIRKTTPLPWYLKDYHVEDFTRDRNSALRRFLESSLPAQDLGITFGQSRDRYLNRATLRSRHTLDSYSRAIDLFSDFLSDRSVSGDLPIKRRNFVAFDSIPLSVLSEEDAPIFLHFVQWLISPSSGKPKDNRPYKPSTVELRLAGVLNWFQFLDDHGWLPAAFKFSKAQRIVRDEMSRRPHDNKPPQPPEHIEEVIYFYDTQQLPASLRKLTADHDRVRRWELLRLRNRALLHALAETGGRISELLSLDLSHFPARAFGAKKVLRVEVIGKGGHSYYLRFLDSLPAIHAYIQARGTGLRASIQGNIPLFISHDPRYDGNRMSRIVAWRIVQRAAHALGLRDITPHDFRHWRATQLINAGYSLDVVQEYLGHRSVETTRSYYAHTDPLRVDEAVKNMGLPGRNNILEPEE